MSPKEPLFHFVSDAFSESAFHVVRFKGREGLSRLYEFSITLVSEQDGLDAAEALQNPARLLMKNQQGFTPYHGVLKSFSVLQKVDKHTFYRAVLVPEFWRLTLNQDCQIFLDKDFKQIAQEVLEQGELTGSRVSLKLTGSYSSWPFVCQYNESHYEFLDRWFRRDGIYYFFDHTQGGDVLKITDSKSSHGALPGGDQLFYAETSALDGPRADKLVRVFGHCRKTIPRKVLLKDYNYEKPTEEVKAEAEADPKGHGEVYVYGEHIRHSSEASRLARVRAESFISRKNVYNGMSSVPDMRSGYTFTLKDHYRSDFNRKYLITAVTHEGAQEAWLTAGLGVSIPDGGDKHFYRNTFEAIEDDVQFRPEHELRPKVFFDAMSAKVWTEGDEDYAHVDEHGRYRLLFPFDISGRGPGKASHDIRKCQPYAGSKHGLHFPLHKNTETLVSFVDGHPDRPVIVHAAPDPEHKSLVTDATHTRCLLTTSGQNLFHVEDKDGHQQIHCQSPTRTTWLRMGKAGGGTPDGFGLSTEGNRTETVNQNETISVSGDMGRQVKGDANTLTKGKSRSTHLSRTSKTFHGKKTDVFLGKLTEIKAGGGAEFAPHWKGIQNKLTRVHGSKTETTLDSEKKSGTETETSGSNNTIKALATSSSSSEKACNGLSITAFVNMLYILRMKTGVAFASVSKTGAATELVGNEFSITIAKAGGGGESTEVALSRLDMKGLHSKVAGSATKLQAAKVALKGNITKLAGDTILM
ncbi:MAG: type VI secretion system Vgr family protein [Desulfovibrionaceae bacterium]